MVVDKGYDPSRCSLSDHSPRFIKPSRTPVLSTVIWSRRQDSNLRHPAPKAGGMNQTILRRANFGVVWSGKGGSNSRPIPWQGIALPAELFPHNFY